MLNRRTFLGGSLAGAALFSQRAPASRRHEPYTVAVIGAGLAGLYAAMELESAGVNVIVLESRHRPGGRVYTLDHVPGRPEGGGNIIGPNYGRVLRMARRFGISLAPAPQAEPMGLMIDGQKIERKLWTDAAINDLPSQFRALSPDQLGWRLLADNPLSASTDWRNPAFAPVDTSASTFYRAAGLSERALAWIDANNSYGNTLATTSMLSLFRVNASIRRAMTMGRPGVEASSGNMRIPEAMAGALQGKIHLGHRVAEFRQETEQVHITCTNGETFSANAAICTLPTGPLQSIAFSPVLRSRHQSALEAMEYHKVTQAHFVADADFWTANGDPGGWWTNGPLGRVFTRQDPAGHFNMTCWINGNACDRYDSLSSTDAKTLLTRDFYQWLPAARGKVTLSAMVSWAKDENNLGAWAVWKPGQIAKHADVLGERHGRIHFAGEHTSWSNSGMEGAMESGERAALEVLRRLA